MNGRVDRVPSSLAPLFIMAMDHRDSFGATLFDVRDDAPTAAQRVDMQRAKLLIYRGLLKARSLLPAGQAGVLVDERYGRSVIDAARQNGVVLAVPIERSGREHFELEFGHEWLTHLQDSSPAYAKVLVRDNPAFPAAQRRAQLQRLRTVSEALGDIGVPLLYELLVPPTENQLRDARGTRDNYDRDVRPGLVTQVIADNQSAGVEPALWKIEGLDTADAARAIVTRARADGRSRVGVIVLGRDAPPQRLMHWLELAASVEGFVGFAIGRSIWEKPLAAHQRGELDDVGAVQAIAQQYLQYANTYSAATLNASGAP